MKTTNASLRKFRILLILLFALSLFGSCKSNKDQTVGDVSIIDIEQGVTNYKSIRLGDICSNIEYIPLQTDENSLTGRYWHYFINNGNLILPTNNHECLTFDINNGSFIGKIGNQGNSGTEYRLIMNASCDPITNEIGIFDMTKMVIFTKEGEFKENFESINVAGHYNISVYQVDLFNNNIILSGSHRVTNNPMSLIVDKKGNILAVDSLRYELDGIKIATDINGLQSLRRNVPDCYSYNRELHFINRHTDTIFAYNTDFAKRPRYVVEYGKYKLNRNESNFDECVYINSKKIFETGKYLFFNLMTNANQFKFKEGSNTKMAPFVYDKEEGTVYGIPFQMQIGKYGMENNIDGGMPFLPGAHSNGKLYQIVSAIDFIDAAEMSNSAEMKKVAANLTEESNPVLIAATLK